jgi:hypothetical protein
MVRRERIIRRMRDRGATHAGSEPDSSQSPTTPVPPPGRSLGRRIGGAIAGRRVFSAPERRHSQPPDIEMGTGQSGTLSTMSATGSPHTADASLAGAQVQTVAGCVEPSTQNRREWARQRALTLLGNNQVPTEGDEEDRTPRWKRGLRRVFPGFR